jgi:pimeloyl-ACP methyl ester carboxylesterase
MTCLEWLRRWPEEVEGMVAINTSVGGLSKPWERMRPRAMVETLRTIARIDPVARERAVLDLTTSRHRDDLELARRQAALSRARPVRRWNIARQILAAGGFRYRGERAHVPLLVLSSAGDRMVAPVCSRAVAEAYGGRLRVHPEAGHDLSLDEPTWCVDEIEAWLGDR